MVETEEATSFRTYAEGYDRHVGRYGPELAAALIEVAGVRPGHRTLDVGCGPGALTVALAKLLGPESVAAVDPSEQFVEVCRERVPAADVRVGVAEELPFGADEFDGALAQLVVQMMSDAPRGVSEMRRATRPGGVVAACVWDFESGMTMLRTYWDAAVSLDPERAGPAAQGALPYCRPAELRELWNGEGLAEVDVGELIVGADYAGFDDFWSPFPAGVGGSGRYCASLDDAGRERLREEVRRRLGSPQGPFRLTARAWYALGWVPA